MRHYTRVAIFGMEPGAGYLPSPPTGSAPLASLTPVGVGSFVLPADAGRIMGKRMPLELRTSAPSPAIPASAALRWATSDRVSARERMEFSERLALLLQTGMPLHAALHTLEQQTPNKRLATAIASIAGEVTAGKSLATALAAQEEIFPRNYASLVGAAEGGGFLAEVLTQLVEMEERSHRLNQALSGAFIYPAFLALLSAAVVVFVLVGVFPKFADMFESIRDQLPPSTLLLMAASDLLRHYWAPLLIVMAVIGATTAHWVRTAAGRATLDRVLFRLPLVREILAEVYMARMMRIMGTSLSNRVTVVDTLAACRDAVPNQRVRDFLAHVESNVVQGKGFASAFQNEPMVPLMVRQMIATGDATGKLALVMARIADYYERELLRKIATLSKLAEPVMLAFMGLAVGIIVSSLILPIFKLARAVH